MHHDLIDGEATGSGAGRSHKPTPANPMAGAGTHRQAEPLRSWRSVPATAITNELLETVAETLSGLAILGEPDWPTHGDAPKAIGIALRSTKDALAPTDLIDIAMSALLRPAFDGNAGAALVLGSIVKRMVAGADGKRLASSWFVRGGLFPDERCRPTNLTSTTDAGEVHG